MLRPIYEFSRSVGYPPPPLFRCVQKCRLVEGYDDPPLSFNVWRSMTTLQYPTCERVWRLSTFTIVNMPPFGTSHHTSLPLSFHRLYLSPSCSLLKPRGRLRVTFEAAMHIASLCRVRSATMDITCHPSSSFMLGRHRCLTVDPHVMVL